MNILRSWIPLALLATLVLGAAYSIVQQDYRTGLDDPQLQMAEDAAAAIGRGAGIENVLAGEMPMSVATSSQTKIDIASSLSPWLAVYSSNGTPLNATGILHGALPKLPQGTFDTTHWRNHGNGTYFNQSPIAQNRFTWQPEPGVRVAIVLVQTADHQYYVAAGRNMREVEQRIEHEGEMVFVAWVVTLAVLLFAVWFIERLMRRA